MSKANSHINNLESIQLQGLQVPSTLLKQAVSGACFLLVIKPRSLKAQTPFLEDHNHLPELEDCQFPGNSKGCVRCSLLLGASKKHSYLYISASPLKRTNGLDSKHMVAVGHFVCNSFNC